MKADEPRYKNTLLGSIMKRINKERRTLQAEGQANIMRRNGIKFADVNTNGFMIQESTRVAANGSETTNYRLFKLVDEEVVTLAVDISKVVTEGIQGHSGGNSDKQQKPHSDSSI